MARIVWPSEGVEFHLHRTTLYNSIFRFDDQMLINQHIFGVYGYVAPILHLRQVDGADLFETYAKSFRRIWGESYPYELPEERLTPERPAPSRP